MMMNEKNSRNLIPAPVYKPVRIRVPGFIRKSTERPGVPGLAMLVSVLVSQP